QIREVSASVGGVRGGIAVKQCGWELTNIRVRPHRGSECESRAGDDEAAEQGADESGAPHFVLRKVRSASIGRRRTATVSRMQETFCEHIRQRAIAHHFLESERAITDCNVRGLLSVKRDWPDSQTCATTPHRWRARSAVAGSLVARRAL